MEEKITGGTSATSSSDLRQLSEKVLQESDELFHAIATLAPVGIYISDPEGNCIYANPAWCRMAGLSLKEALGRGWIKGLHPDDRASVFAKWQQMTNAQGDWGMEYRFRTPDGKVTTVFGLAAPQCDAEGRILRYVGVNMDITDRIQAEESLQASEHYWRATFNAVSDGVSLVGADGQILNCNEAQAKLFGKSRAEIIGHRCFEVMHGTSQPIAGCPILRTRQTKHREHLELRVGDRWFNIVVDPVLDPQGQFTSAVHIMSDITERKQAEEREKELRARLERAARMESLGVLAGGAAHELNNALGPLVGLPDMVIEYIERHGDPADPEHADTLKSMQTMKASALRATGLVSDLVVMGGRGQFRQKPVDVNRTVEQMLDSQQIRTMQVRRPNVQVSKQLSDKSLWCLGSASKLARALANLVINAAEAIDGQGNVIVRTGRQLFAEICHGYEEVPAGNYVTIEVTDTGCGMDSKTMARIFEPFFSTKSQSERSGGGLGLSVVHGLVKDHTGFLNVKSEAGKGATFTVYLPAVAEEVKAASAKDQLPGGHERILAVDDEPAQLFLSQRQLKRLGYDVTVVSSGEEAVALFEAAGRDGKSAPFDLVLTDMVMPGLNGLSMCKAILRLYPEQKLVILSGYAPEKYEQQVKLLGIDWLTKPCSPAELACTLRARLDG